MVLHELVTNAVKYGALRQPNGHLTIRWRQETSGESGKSWFRLDWKESVRGRHRSADGSSALRH